MSKSQGKEKQIKTNQDEMRRFQKKYYTVQRWFTGVWFADLSSFTQEHLCNWHLKYQNYKWKGQEHLVLRWLKMYGSQGNKKQKKLFQWCLLIQHAVTTKKEAKKNQNTLFSFINLPRSSRSMMSCFAAEAASSSESSDTTWRTQGKQYHCIHWDGNIQVYARS